MAVVSGHRGPDIGSAAEVVVALPFAGGAILAAYGPTRVVKTPWGLLSGVGLGTAGATAAAALARAEARFHELPPVGVSGVAAELARASGCDCSARGSEAAGRGQGLVWLFSHEVDPLRTYDPTRVDPRGPAAGTGETGWLGAPVGIYRDAGAGPAVTRWGAVVLVCAEDPARATWLTRDAELQLLAGLDRGVDLRTRLRLASTTIEWAVREVVGGWGDSGGPPAGMEAIVGIHEAGHVYSVDRVALASP